MKTAGYVLLALVAVLALTWIVQGNEFFLYKVFAPKRAEVERQVFENTRSFNEGMVQELQAMRFEYAKEDDPEAKKAMASVILHRADGYDLNDPLVPQDLRNFIEQLREEQ
jgi:hypothetical protein